VSIVGQERRARTIGSMRVHPEVADRCLAGHRDILAALRTRDPDAAEQAFRCHAQAGVDLLLTDPD
jgi:DNA-binding GntR family transcriptional regulator